MASGDGDRRLIKAGMVLASELSLDAVLQSIVELGVDLTGGRYGAPDVLTPEADRSRNSSPSGSRPKSERLSGTRRSATACSVPDP